jgi:cyanophycinase
MKIQSISALTIIFFVSCSEEPITNLANQNETRTSQVISAAKPGGGGTTGPTVYTTGSSADVATSTSFGIALIGGAESDTPAETAAFQFLVAKSGGGDFVVLRSSGADGYNDYVYTTIGGVNSVETIMVTSRTLADHATTEALVRNAEAIFIAGGDQADYVNYWKDTKLEAAINYAINTKNIQLAARALASQFSVNFTTEPPEVPLQVQKRLQIRTMEKWGVLKVEVF